ncbi:MAG: cofactor-independent phosphoglycerate mutase [Firmicutes bacterium]|nr:cofactor-independent phosphoglycerate mutase [Bacillota bacterium]
MNKYILILGDGMSDYYSDDSPSPLMSANKPNIDRLAGSGEMGLVCTVPEGFSPGSDVANLSILGYDPKQHYSGRSSLEALSMGIKLNDGDITYRCNLVTITDGIMKDYSAGGISNKEANELIQYLSDNLDLDGLELHAGISYRHCLVQRKNTPNNNSSLLIPNSSLTLTPPHDITDKDTLPYLPKGHFLALTKQSQKLLVSHPINLARIKKGLNPANSIWIWGQGTKPTLNSFEGKYGIKGAMISPVDLLKGIAIASGMTNIDVNGITACIDTNYKAMSDATLKALKTHDFVYLHIPAPDECGHIGDYNLKKKSIELIDQKVVGYLLNKIDPNCTLIIMPDHATPVSIKTHTRDAVPYLIANNEKRLTNNKGQVKYNEANAKNTGNFIPEGHNFLQKIIQK